MAGWAVVTPDRGEVILIVSVYESLQLMIGFASLIVALIAVVISLTKKK